MESSILDFFNNREIATAIWLLVLIGWVIYKKETRASLIQLIKAFFAWKLTISYLAMLAYISTVVYLLYSIEIWKWSLIASTTLWVAFGAFSMLMNHERANNENFFFESIKEQFKILVFLEFVINFYVFSLWAELIIVPVSAFVGGMLAVAESKEEYRPAKKTLNIIISAFGTFVIIYAIYMLINDFSNFISLENLRSFIVPIVLTLSFLPFIYFAALSINYETLFTRLSFITKEKHVYKYAKARFISTFGINLKKLNKWSKEMNKYHFETTECVDNALSCFEKIGCEESA